MRFESLVKSNSMTVIKLKINMSLDKLMNKLLCNLDHFKGYYWAGLGYKQTKNITSTLIKYMLSLKIMFLFNHELGSIRLSLL